MARGHIKVLVADMRSDYLKIAVALLYLAQELLETVAQSGTLRDRAGGRHCKRRKGYGRQKSLYAGRNYGAGFCFKTGKEKILQGNF